MPARVTRFALVLAGALFPIAAAADPLTLERSFLNPSPNAGDQFGKSVSLSGGKALISAPLDATTGSGSGRAYIFDVATGALLHTLENPSPGPATNDFFGQSVSLSGNFALVGAQNDDTSGTNTGAAYLFDATTGALVRTILNPGPAPITTDNFGNQVSLYGNRALISAIGDDTGASNAGAAYLIDTTTGALVRTFTNPIPGPTSGDNFGFDVALFGDRALISTISDDTAALNAGAAYLFDTDTGMLLHTFLNPTPELNNVFGNNDNFGFEVALSGNRILIGAVNENVNGFHNGAAYLYDLATFALIDTLLIPTPNSDTEEFLGEGLALSDDWALVGAAFRNKDRAFIGQPTNQFRDLGAAFLFDADTGAFLQEIGDLLPLAGDVFGKAVALDGNQALIAAHQDRIPNVSTGVNSGQVFFYVGPAAAPEPATLAVMAFGLAALFAFRQRSDRCHPGRSAAQNAALQTRDPVRRDPGSAARHFMPRSIRDDPSGHFSILIGFESVPMPSISTSHTSPGFIHKGGFRAKPTPDGVPDTMMSPGNSVIASEILLMSVFTSNAMSRVLAFCTTWPLRRVWRRSPLASAGSSSAVTKSGPNPPDPSKFLPMSHCGDLNCQSRTEPSLKIE